jgi:predicted dehydrogenase
MPSWLNDIGKNTHPKKISVVGGGRWARVIGGVLHSSLTSHDTLSFHTSSNFEAMRLWADGLRGPTQVFVSSVVPVLSSLNVGAVVVANATPLHVSAARLTLAAGIPTLVEKPLASNHSAALELIQFAEARGVGFACSHVFLFARYIQRFLNISASRSSPERILLEWTDPQAEMRYGEVKSYDPGLPLLNDILPHAVPLLLSVVRDPLVFFGLRLSKGGARVELDLMAGPTAISLVLERNSAIRRRYIDVASSEGVIAVDFSDEPGRIFVDNSEIDCDLESHASPLKSMLNAFLDGAFTGSIDPRLSPSLALESCRLSDEALKTYRELQAQWLMKQVGVPVNDDIRYALTELISSSQSRLKLTDKILEIYRREWMAEHGH